MLFLEASFLFAKGLLLSLLVGVDSSPDSRETRLRTIMVVTESQERTTMSHAIPKTDVVGHMTLARSLLSRGSYNQHRPGGFTCWGCHLLALSLCIVCGGTRMCDISAVDSCVRGFSSPTFQRVPSVDDRSQPRYGTYRGLIGLRLGPPPHRESPSGLRASCCR